ncbi:hypothetical protein A3C59_01410 [Candidatus Daviesbacteria bacterium RIFCSPHIGHO2_02_FULL_36_13]|uniref:Uncharacterized protein n=1 Tax=Candidatus Daviesbacteria bacterium RIFCSPHIGHO2_02_FULL_36_13 TaxID=1797768 RepID=A0A1F5JV62_9BACT|nr:MAG: hypothetical protein A3C59_01410 [Candidatus Daviesbacteria bacterium RIFCSPHIGHO2_02_FULL_36_13]
MPFIWDYDIKELRKTESGRLLILERMINYGPDKGEKISLSDVKESWNKIKDNLFEEPRKLMELLIWGRYQSSPKNKKLFWVR